MIATSLAAALAILAPAPQDVLPSGGPVAYSSQAPGATYQGRVLNDQDTALFRQGLASARARDVAGTRSTLQQIGDPTARKLVEWALIDTSAQQLSYVELVRAKRDMAAWPRGESRQAAGERALDLAGAGADETLAFFDANDTFATDFSDDFGDQCADFAITSTDGGDFSDTIFFVGNWLSEFV